MLTNDRYKCQSCVNQAVTSSIITEVNKWGQLICSLHFCNNGVGAIQGAQTRFCWVFDEISGWSVQTYLYVLNKTTFCWHRYKLHIPYKWSILNQNHLNYRFAVWSNHELWHVGFRGHKDVGLKELQKLDHISVGYFEFSPKLCQLILTPLHNTEHFFSVYEYFRQRTVSQLCAL